MTHLTCSIVLLLVNSDPGPPILLRIPDCHWVLRPLRVRNDINCQIYHSGLTARAVDRKFDPFKIRLGAMLFDI